jgi:hypothetical protein
MNLLVRMRVFRSSLLLLLLFASAATVHADNCTATQDVTPGPGVQQWRRWETSLTSQIDYFGANGKGNPSRDLELDVTFTRCNVTSLVQYKTQGFWYGLAADGSTLDSHAFRIRGAFPPGVWQWEVTSCHKRDGAGAATPDCGGDGGLKGQKGRFRVTMAKNGLLYSGGFLQVAPASPPSSGFGHYLTLNGQSRFFWLGDTAWNSTLLMNEAQWESYIQNRSSPDVGMGAQFTAVQLATAPLAAASVDTAGNPPFDRIDTSCPDAPGACYRMNPRFWKGVDDKIEYANQKGLVVFLAGFIEPQQKSLTDDYSKVLTDPEEAKKLAQAVTARLYGNFVVFSPGFDHKLSDNISIIDKVGAGIGDDILGVTARHLVTNHSAGSTDVGDYTGLLHGKSWLDFELYQSGTSSKATSICNRTLQDGSPDLKSNELCNLTDRAASMAETLFKAGPKTKPAINGEASYVGQEDLEHPNNPSYWDNHRPYQARQTAYLSLLSGAAGYSMGTCGVIDWGKWNGLAGCRSSLHWDWNDPDPAFTAKSMKLLRATFQSIFWERLKPQSGRIANQLAAPEKRMALAYDGSSAFLAYLPHEDGKIWIDFRSPSKVSGLWNADQWPSTWIATWVSPRSLFSEAVVGTKVSQGVFEFKKPTAHLCELTTPCDAVDWVLKIVKKGAPQPPPNGVVLSVVNGPGLGSEDLRILAQTADIASGEVLDQEEIGGDGTAQPGTPRLATEPAGNSMAVWQAGDDGETTISGRVLDGQGQPLTPEFVIAAGDTASPGHPSVAALANGDFVVVWAGSDPNRYGPWVRAQRFNALGMPLASPTILDGCELAAGDFPQVAALSGGGYAVAWEMSGGGIYVLRVDAGGSLGDARVAEGAGAATVLESLEDDGSGTPWVSYGLYAPDGTVVAENALSVATTAGSCSSTPLAVDDAFSADRDRPITIGVQELLANDAPGVAFVQASAKCPVSADGTSCTYTPPPGFLGTDSFTYSVRDSADNTGSATVTITVLVPLVANPDQFSTTAGVPIQVTSAQLLQNDSPGAVFVRAENPFNGTLELIDSTNGFVYRFTPAAGFAGTAGFEYLISRDGNPPYQRGTVTITVTDAPPRAIFTVSCVNRACTARPTSTDDLGISHYFWNWGDGTPTVEATSPYPWVEQTHTYAQSGRYTITHTVVDTAGQTNALQLDVVPNTRPVAANDSATTERDIPVTVNVLANDSDADGDALLIGSVTLQNPGASYQVVQSGTSWAIKITPPDTFVGTLTFTYVAYDRWGAGATATVTLNVTQWTSITDAVGEQWYCNQNSPLRVPKSNLLANDYDSDGDPLTIAAMDTSILMGTLDCVSDPAVCTYTPPLNAAGTTLFRYTVSDPAGHRDSATVRIYVSVRGSAPTAKDDWLTTTRNTVKTFTVQDVVQNDLDADGDTLTVTLLSGNREYGSLACSTPMYRCTYTPTSGFVGTDRFAYTAGDGLNAQTSATINLLTLPPPTPAFDAREDVVVTGMNQQVYVSNAGLTSNDYDPEHDPISVSAIDGTGLQGTLTCDASGCLFKPFSNFLGVTRFKYTATDGHGSSDTATVKVRVGGTNTPPVVAPDSFSTPKNTPLRFSVFELLKNDYDPDNDPLNVTVYPTTAQKGTLSCGTPSYWCTYTPNANVTGADTITYLVTDAGGSATSTFTVNILP